MRIDRVKLAAAIARADLKINDLASRSGVTRATISAIKGGKSCSDQTAQRLAAGLGVSLPELLEDNGLKVS